MVRSFEVAFSEYVGTQYCISVASGTDAIEISLRALGCEGKEVLIVANAGGYGTISCLAVGATPVYVDIDKTSLLISVSSIIDRVSLKTGAIVITHLFGLAVDCSEIEKAIKTKIGRSIPIIEDCAQAHGAVVGNKRVGSQSTMACFSFYPTKNLGAMGDGGAITTDNAEIADRVSQLRQYGWTQRYFQGLSGGRNSRLDELQAGFLSLFLKDLDQRNSKRRAIVKKYVDHGAIAVHGDFAQSEQYVAHLAVCVVDNREELVREFESLGVPTSVHYPFLDTEFSTTQHLKRHSIPNSVAAKDKIVSLPCFPEMSVQEVDLVCKAVEKFQRYFKNL